MSDQGSLWNAASLHLLLSVLSPYIIAALLMVLSWLTPYEAGRISMWDLRLTVWQKLPFLMAALGMPLNLLVLLIGPPALRLPRVGSAIILSLGLIGLTAEGRLLLPVLRHLL